MVPWRNYRRRLRSAFRSNSEGILSRVSVGGQSGDREEMDGDFDEIAYEPFGGPWGSRFP